jgi:drug/metabolite transporter (DMT)-like permease
MIRKFLVDHRLRYPALYWWLCVSGGVVSWAWSYILIKWALVFFDPAMLAYLRLAAAGVLFGVLFAGYLRVRVSVTDVVMLLVMAIMLIACSHSLNFSSTVLHPSVVSCLAALPPTFVAVLSFVLWGKKVSKVKLLGLLVAMCSMVSLFFVHRHEIHYNLGLVMGVILALCHAIFLMVQKKIMKRHHFASVLAWASIMATTMILLFGSLNGAAINTQLPKQAWLVYFASVFSLVFGYVCWSYALSFASVIRIASFSYIIPLMTALLAWCVLGQVAVWYDWLACVFMLLGVVLVQVCREDWPFLPQKNHPG